MARNINPEVNYTISEIKQMYEDDYESLLNLVTTTKGGVPEERGQSELSRRIGIPQQTISSYMSFFKVCPEIQRIFLENGSKGERSKKC